MVKKKTQGCFATFLYFVGNFPSFSKLLDALGKRLKVHVIVKQCWNNTWVGWINSQTFIGFPSHPIFCSSNTSFLSWLRLLYLKYIRNLEDEAGIYSREEYKLKMGRIQTDSNYLILIIIWNLTILIIMNVNSKLRS